jgi:hypothetical protein
MTRVLHGVVHGKTIVISEDLGMWDGQAVELVVTPSGSLEHPPEGSQLQKTPKKLPGPPPGWRPGAPSKVAGVLADEWTEEDDRILDQIQADRKASRWRELPE